MSRNVLKSSLLSAILNMAFQIFCRLLTFGINIFMVRSIGRDVLGIINVRLLLLESTIIFLSREAISRASLSTSSTKQLQKCSWAQLINHQWLTLPICLCISLVCVQIWRHIMLPVENDLLRPQYHMACYAIALGCMIEFCAEAPVFVSQVFCFVKLKVVISTLQILVRSCVFLWLVFSLDSSKAIQYFALAQILSAMAVVVGYYGFYNFYIPHLRKYREALKKKDDDKQLNHKLFENMDDFALEGVVDFLPGAMLKSNEDRINKDLLKFTMSFTKQTFVKQILTEGEKYVMSLTPGLTFSEQATYDIVNNLGSLCARFIFRPIEDSSYFYFTQTIARDVKLQEQPKTKISEAAQVLQNLLLGITSIGLLGLTFGQNYSHAVLYFYGGANFVSDNLPEKLLRCHCIAIYFLAINGITEGYMFATNTSKQIDKYNYVMGVFSIIFIVMSFVLTRIFGPVGFILANCINMLCRICSSCKYIWKQFLPLDHRPLKGLNPGKFFTLALISAYLLCYYSKKNCSLQLHLLVGVFSVIFVLLLWVFENKAMAKQIWSYKKKLKAN
ncbi:man(5)GlcNAc(2)-PP-dolichol translocation protein RFT1 [Haematobia irritans]|uniref:man(5)GlcNAc(2)-PP-dolichol translocation protein RFT1 n=1 Tax=Haematobia irritans TaxID=7368 RepID=UPI003F506A9B